MIQERWKDVEGYEGLYQVSDFGKIKTMRRKIRRSNNTSQSFEEKIRVGHSASNGYIFAHLCKDGISKNRTVHSLVGRAFVPNPENKPIINHKNGNKTDNHYSNIEWVTYSENNFHAYRVLNKKAAFLGKPTVNAKKVLCLDTGTIYNSISEAAKAVGYSVSRLAWILGNNCKNRTSLIFYTDRVYSLYLQNKPQ